MRLKRSTLVASPVLVGAVTVLVAIVAVFVSYNANQGLPFVPTYRLSAQLENGSKLIPGNDVRAGGFRVGQITDIRPARVRVDDEVRSIAVIEMDLDERIKPLAVDSTVSIRARSALGLQYVELTPGRSSRGYKAGDTIPLRRTDGRTNDLENLLETFEPETRDAARKTLVGFGDGLAGRGPALNVTIEELNPFLTRLTPVMRALSDPDTELRNLFPALGATVAQAAPVADVQARWITEMADTFAAIGRDPEALRETIDESPPTLAAATTSLRVQTPFLARFADVSRRLQPAAAELPRSLSLINGALSAGIPAFRRTPELSDGLEQLFVALEDLGENPNTLFALRDLRQAARVGRPALEFVAPYQTVCNYLNYFFTPLGTHQSEVVAGGTSERILAKLLGPPTGSSQPNTLGTTQSTRPADVPANEDPQDPPADNPQALHSQPGGPAVDPRGRADCQDGQTGYLNRLVNAGRYPPSNNPQRGGGSHVVIDPDSPGPAGGTYTGRKLGIDSVEDVR
jgi:phospholipid/cholesterol/gamma-HCH transport system substrate-binding protein